MSSYTYKLKGTRYLKKYTAPNTSPVYSAAVDAAAVVDALCDIDWEKSPEGVAQMSYHTTNVVDADGKTTGLDANAKIREKLDAALWCAEHVGGLHRAYAQAACYVLAMPEMAQYPNLVSVKAKVTSDPYCSMGVRLAVHTSDTLEIPKNCSVARTGDAHTSPDGNGIGKMPRTANTVDGVEYWFPSSGDVTVTLPESHALKKYIFLVVALENYAVSRGDWVEGSAFIAPTIEITTDGELTGWDDGGSYDAVDAETQGGFVAAEGFTESVTANQDHYTDTSIMADYTAASASGVSQYSYDAENEVASVNSAPAKYEPENLTAAVRMVYSMFRAGEMVHPDMDDFNSYHDVDQGKPGAGFLVCVKPEIAYEGHINTAKSRVVTLSLRRALHRFVAPKGFAPRFAKFKWSPVASTGKVWFNAWLKFGSGLVWYDSAELRSYKLHTAEDEKVSVAGAGGATSEWLRIASFENVAAYQTGTPSLTVPLPFEFPAGAAATILLTAYAEPTAGTFTDGDIIGMGKSISQSNLTISSSTPNYTIYFSPVATAGWQPKITLFE